MVMDNINGVFEAVGGLFIFLNVLKLHKDKKVRGVSWVSIVFFTLWGYWNLIFYPAIGQMTSTLFAGLTALVNTAWLAQILYYNRKERVQCQKTKTLSQ
jgi:uncharacterized membrane protein YfcA